jgi:hypothetical protein
MVAGYSEVFPSCWESIFCTFTGDNTRDPLPYCGCRPSTAEATLAGGASSKVPRNMEPQAGRTQTYG